MKGFYAWLDQLEPTEESLAKARAASPAHADEKYVRELARLRTASEIIRRKVREKYPNMESDAEGFWERQRRKLTGEPAIPLHELLDHVVLPRVIETRPDRFVPTLDRARAVAEDQHPGDDAIGPQQLLHSVESVVNLRRLAERVKAAGGRLDLTGEVARDVVDAHDDTIQLLANMAVSDVCEDAVNIYGMHPEKAAIVLVAGALLREQTAA